MVADESHDDRTQSFAALTSGTMVSHYKIIEKIGAGGMGEVYLALDTTLKRKVALKFLPPHLCQDEECRKRFTREAQAAAGLDHPNIAAIYEVGEYQSRPFYSMQVVEGQSLKDVITGKDLLVERILEIAIQVCEGLQAAHDKGIIHRDVKPSNILLDVHGRVRIVDFGLAAIKGSEHLTKTGSTLGTIGYMSPEQVQGRETDHRSDLFSLGVVLYELITKQNPFKRDSEAATLRAVIDYIPEPLARYKRNIPEPLEAISDKLLEKSSAHRYQTAAGVLSDLHRLAEDRLSGSGRQGCQPSIAVLPFANLSGDPEQEYFCDGMAEEIINALTHVKGLRVVARTSCFAFKGKHEDVRDIGRKLNVDHVLEGSIRKSGSRVRVTGQLVKISDGFQLWSDKFERDLIDVFEVQDEISIAIVEKLKVRLLGGEREQIVMRPTENLKAYNLYLKGRFHWNNRSSKEIQKAIECLKKAVELDPQFSLGYAALADAYIIQADNTEDYEGRLAVLASAEESVFRALELDNSLGEAHTALAQIRFAQWKWHDAEREHLSAIKLSPRYATARHWYALFLAARGKHEQAQEQIKLARDLDPLSPPIIAAQAFCSYLSRQYDKTVEICREGFEINPDFPLYSLLTGWSLLEQGSYNEAVKQFHRSIELAGKWLEEKDDSASWTVHVGRAYAMMGEHSKAKDILEATISRTKDRHGPLFPIATLYFALGELDRGFEWLDRSVEKQDFWIPLFRFSPVFDTVRDDPRFLSLMNIIGLDQDTQESSHD